MQILVLGDSWAVELSHMDCEKHLVSFLKEKGHTIYNCGIAGGSNLASLEKAKKYINTPNKIDWVIWFHTELSRDKRMIGHKKMPNTTQYTITIKEFIDQLSMIVYSAYKKFFQELDCKVAVIGGCADLSPTFHDYIQPDFCIPSWQQQIIGVSAECLSTPTWVPFTNDSTENKLARIQSHDDVRSAMEVSDDFPDNDHPGTRPHQDLANHLLAIFNCH